MTIVYPSSIDNLITIPKVTDGISPVLAKDHNTLVDAILAVEGELGINPSGVYGTVKDRLDSIEVSSLDGYFLAKGDLLTSSGSGPLRFEVGPDGYVLTADSTEASGLRWAPDDDSGGTVTGTGVVDRLAYWSGTSSITSSGNLTFDGANLEIAGEVRPVSGIRFDDGSLQTSALILGANTALSNLSPTSINRDLLPLHDDGYKLGSPALRWRDGYLTLISVDEGAIFNDSNSATGDFRIKGFSVDHLFFGDVSTEKVGIHTSTPQTTLHVEGDGYFNGYLKMANTIASPSAAGAGAFKWTGQALEFSDGYAWKKTFRKIGASTRDLWVDIVAGSDANAGTITTPLKTIQEAVLRFKQPEVGPVHWDHGDDRWIHVVYTAGMPKIVENVLIPPHTGSGYLIIEGEEQVLHSGLTQSGAIASIAGFQVRNRITIAETIPSGAYADNAFLRPTGLITNTPLEDTWENLPIVTNGTNTIDVTAYSPGIRSAFYYMPGATVDIVRPRIVWSWNNVDISEFYTHQPMIVNHGAPLIISGFVFETLTNSVGAGTNALPAFMANTATGVSVNEVSGGTLAATRCVFRPGFSDADTANAVTSLIVGDGTCLNGDLITLEVTHGLGQGSNQTATNLRLHDGYGDIWPKISGSADGYYTLDMGGSNAALVLEKNSIATLAADIRSGRLIVRGGAAVVFLGTIEGAGIYPAIQVGSALDGHSPENSTGQAQIKITYAAGSSGNTNVGLRVGDHCLAILNGSATLSGTLGQVKVGDMASLNWSETELIDITRSARYVNI